MRRRPTSRSGRVSASVARLDAFPSRSRARHHRGGPGGQPRRRRAGARPRATGRHRPGGDADVCRNGTTPGAVAGLGAAAVRRRKRPNHHPMSLRWGSVPGPRGPTAITTSTWSTCKSEGRWPGGLLRRHDGPDARGALRQPQGRRQGGARGAAVRRAAGSAALRAPQPDALREGRAHGNGAGRQPPASAAFRCSAGTEASGRGRYR